MDSNNILNLVLTTYPNRVGEVCVLESFSRCYHCLIIFKYILQFVQEDSSDNMGNYFIFNKRSYSQILKNIMVVDWVTEFYGKSTN